jgi:hypothetical protein
VAGQDQQGYGQSSNLSIRNTPRTPIFGTALRLHRPTTAIALGITDHVWSIGELLDVALVVAPPAPTETAPERRRRFKVIKGGLPE